MSYQYTNSRSTTYYLHRSAVILRGHKVSQTIYFFTKNANGKGEPCDLPTNCEVMENTRSGMPLLRKKR